MRRPVHLAAGPLKIKSALPFNAIKPPPHKARRRQFYPYKTVGY